MSPHNPTRMRPAFFAVLLMIAALSMAACSSAPPTEKSSAQPAKTTAVPAKSHVVLISGFKYQPEVLTVNAGDTVEWQNKDIVPHSATASDKSFDSGNIASGASWKFVAGTKGTYYYLCTLHPNMKARLVVE